MCGGAGVFLNRLGLNEFFWKFLVEFHWIEPPKNSQNFVEKPKKTHYPDATPLKISIRTHSIPACMIMYGRTLNKSKLPRCVAISRAVGFPWRRTVMIRAHTRVRSVVSFVVTTNQMPCHWQSWPLVRMGPFEVRFAIFARGHRRNFCLQQCHQDIVSFDGLLNK